MTSTTAFTQAEKVAQYLKAGRTLTSAQARSMWDVRNLRARISDLRKAGFKVSTHINTRGTTAYSISGRASTGNRSR